MKRVGNFFEQVVEPSKVPSRLHYVKIDKLMRSSAESKAHGGINRAEAEETARG
jgi:hypothetical protein